ncbi:ATP-binding cassette domain-containing protein [Salmonella enterica subsp. enterica serovar Weltevreden]|nr:ATP-binding cassette domain-containing protein [Salmonella enterica subsp. enterica serovar Weltevreden]
MAVVGASGSGKSAALLMLLAALYDPPPAGMAQHHYGSTGIFAILKLTALRRRVGSQCLKTRFCLPVRIVGKTSPMGARKRLRTTFDARAADTAGASRFHQYATGFNTRLTERGSNLSGGQRQRIAR